jgi:Tol biopolymer transport system component
MKTDGSGQTNLSDNREYDGERCSWSPDGTSVAFVSMITGRTVDFEIYVVSVDGGDVTNLTDNPAVDDFPAWSPRCEEAAGEGA